MRYGRDYEGGQDRSMGRGPMGRHRGYDRSMESEPMWRGRGYDRPMGPGPMWRERGYDSPMRSGVGGGGPHWYGDTARDEMRYRAAPDRPGTRMYGGDYWYLGEHAMGRARYDSDYDRAYRRFSERTHPRFSPVGGMYGPMGGQYSTGSMPRPVRENSWFSDWTRWF